MEGRRMVMILAPKAGVVRKAAEARKHAIAAQLAQRAAEKHGTPLAPSAKAAIPQQEELAPLDQSEFDEDEDEDEDEDDN
jgi:hypothetical protein